MALCCWINMLRRQLRLLYCLVVPLVVLGVITIPLAAVLFFLLRWWVQSRAKHLLPHLRQETSKDGKVLVVGFFHPYCNAGGGGERVLWTAIRALQNKYPFVKCVVYTGDTGVTGQDILETARHRFNIVLPKPVEFVFLTRRNWVEADKYPYFTLLGQSLGSVVLGFEALMKYVPDVYIDSMGYAFTVPLFKYFGGCKVSCYVHYPTISTDMLERVSQRTQTYNNASFISRSPFLSSMKLIYYRIFAGMYGIAGKRCKVVMVNSSWTQGHILSLWQAPDRTHIVYPPCDTREFLQLPLKTQSKDSVRTIVSIAQFRPEKDHPLQIRSFQEYLSRIGDQKKNVKLILVGSVRNEDDSQRVEGLKTLCSELGVEENVEFQLNVPFAELKQLLNEATIGLHTMWNEHFGIGVVELMAAGAVTLAHNSGGPKMDIVVDYNGEKTGFLANDVKSYADAMGTIFNATEEDLLRIRQNARESVKRFSEEEFECGFLSATEPLFVTSTQ